MASLKVVNGIVVDEGCRTRLEPMPVTELLLADSPVLITTGGSPQTA